MNKNIIYIGTAAVIGLLAGYLIFGGKSETAVANKNGSEMSKDHDHSGESGEQMWTCSMHPQIMQPESGDCPICGMDLIPAESGAEGLAMNEIKMTKNALALANISTTVVGTGMADGDNMISLSGKIAVNGDQTSTQPAHYDGRIEKLYVNSTGVTVRKGQPVAQVYSPELVAAQQELITAYKIRESQPQLYQAVRNKFKNWKIHGSQLNEVEKSGKVKTNFIIYSHVSGVVTGISVNEGAHLMDGHPIFNVSNLNSVWAEFDAFENQISQFKKGQKIKLTTNAYPGREFDATLSFIDPVLDTRTRTVTVRATLKNNEGLFKPGMFVKGTVEGKSDGPSQLLTVPASAVLWTGERSLVYVKTNPDEPVFEMREVTLGNKNGETFTILSGLQNGEEIVTNGTFTVDAAAQLQGKKSMMNQGKGGGKPIEPMTDMEMKLPETFQKNFEKAMAPYFEMKDAFIEGNPEKVLALAKATLKEIESIPASGLGTMEKSHFLKIPEILKAIIGNNNLENQRAHFVILNENMVAIAMNIKNFNSRWFVQKCPMANSNKGAVWLSREKEIRNPYYGEQMLTCGSVIRVIQ